jgi:glutaminyl-peptide cyclotransferase
MRAGVALLVLGSAIGCMAQAKQQPRPTPVNGYQIVHVYPHDPSAFTQGLVYSEGHLYESTGLNGKSSVRLVDLQSGQVQQRHDLPSQYFGEGLTIWKNKLYQLTWKANTGFVYDAFTLLPEKTFTYTGEGWGLTQNEKELILSDGTSFLRFLDPQSFREVRRIQVRDAGRTIDKLNELEYVRGEIYANIWQTDRIARISPNTGKVLAWIDLTGLIDKSQLPNADAVLNGIAYDSTSNRLFVTGKLWPKLFEIRVTEKQPH